MKKLEDTDTSISEMFESFLGYKINRYKNVLDRAVRKMKGEVTCESEILTEDCLTPQYLFNSVTDRILQKSYHSFLLEPFK